MFPTGLPGIGLIAIRVTVAAMLLVDGSPYGVPQSMGRAIGSLVAAVCLVFGSSLRMPRHSRDAWNSGDFVRETMSIYST